LALALAAASACEPEEEARNVEPAEEPRSLEFSGYPWSVKTSLPETAGPGPNYFSNSEDNVWVDSDGRLHLRIEKRAGVWYAAEVVSEDALGLGEHHFFLEGPVDRMDPNAVLGLFTWDDDPAENHREIDIELSRWGDPDNENSQFVVQPFDTAGNLRRFESALSGDLSRYRFDWQPGQIVFLAQRGQDDDPSEGDVIAQWEYAGPDIPTPGSARTRMNLWLMSGEPPSDGDAVEAIVNAFVHVP
jgi:hypothetical protein